MKIYTFCRQTSLLLSHSTFQTKFFHYSWKHQRVSPQFPVAGCVSAECLLRQLLQDQSSRYSSGRPQPPPTCYLHPHPFSSRVRQGKEMVSHYMCLRDTVWCVRNKSSGLLRIEVTKGLWSTLTKATLALHVLLHVLHGWREQVTGPPQYKIGLKQMNLREMI